MDFLQLGGKTVVVMGIANRKSVAYHVAKILVDAGAELVNVVRSEERRETTRKLFPDARVFVCDVEYPDQIEALTRQLADEQLKIDGLLHSIAFADYGDGMKPFHETTKVQFLRTMDVSCYSLIAVANALKPLLTAKASVVTVSISTTRMANQNYGFMAPVKAALDSSLAFLAKSFSEFSEVRFNRRRARAFEDQRLCRNPRLCGRLSVRRTGDSTRCRRADRRSSQRCRVPAEPALQRNQCRADRRRCRHGHQLLRRRNCQESGALRR